MSVFSYDILMFILWTVIFFKINKKNSISVRIVKNVVSFFPPLDEDKKYIKEGQHD